MESSTTPTLMEWFLQPSAQLPGPPRVLGDVRGRDGVGSAGGPDPRGVGDAPRGDDAARGGRTPSDGPAAGACRAGMSGTNDTSFVG